MTLSGVYVQLKIEREMILFGAMMRADGRWFENGKGISKGGNGHGWDEHMMRSIQELCMRSWDLIYECVV